MSGLGLNQFGFVIGALALVGAIEASAQAPNPYALPTIYPNYPADSTFKSMVPAYAPAPPVAQPPQAIVVPLPLRNSAPAPAPVPDSGGLYRSSGGGANALTGGSTFHSDYEPIVDPSSVPKEITFEPRAKRASGLPAPTPTATEFE